MITPLHIPQALANTDRWLNWRKGQTKQGGKFDKIPFDAATNKAINDKDPATWRPLAACQGRGQLGYAIGGGKSIIDLDGVRNPTTGAISPPAQAIIDQAASYTEISPSGRGIKIFLFGALPRMVKAAIDDTGGTLEIYSEKRFSTFTGLHLDGTPTELANAQLLLDQLAQRYAPPVPERAQRVERAPIAVSSDLATLRQQALDIVTRLRAGRLDPLTFTALYNQLNTELNPAIKAAVPAAFNAAYTIDQVLEDHGCELVTRSSAASYYSGVPGDRHTHTISLKVHDGRVFALSSNSRLWNDTTGHDAFSAYTILAHAGNAKAAQAAAADLLAPLAPHAAVPMFTFQKAPEPIATSTPEQRHSWAAAKAQQRSQQRDQAAAIHAAIIDQANSDPALLDKKGRGTIAFAVLLVLLDSAEGRTWCRLAVATIAQRLDRCVGHVRRGLAQLEKAGYISTERHVNTITGEIWSGGRNGETPKRTLCDLRVVGIAAPQTAELGRSSQIDDDRHDLVTRSHAEGDNNQQARAVEQPAIVAPIAIAGGASFDPAAALAPAGQYSGRTKADLSHDDRWDGLTHLHADYRRTHPQPAPADLVEPEQQPLLVDAPKAKRRRSRRPPSNDVRTLEKRIITLERKAANIARTNPKQAWALRHQADAARSALSLLAELGDAELERTDPTPAEPPPDRAALSVISVPVGSGPTLADLRALAQVRSAQLRAQP